MVEERTFAEPDRPRARESRQEPPTPAAGAMHQILFLQRAAGNRHVARLIAGPPRGRPALAGAGDRPQGPTTPDTEHARRAGASPPGAPPGRPEQVVEADLAGVRMHADSARQDYARALETRADTTAEDLHFAEGADRPGTIEGNRPLAHEVARAVQPREDSGAAQRGGGVSQPGGAHEQEVESLADALVRGGEAPVTPASAGARISRAKTFTPRFGGAAGVFHFENLNAAMKFRISIRNARSAPAGTTFLWSWREPDVEGVEKGDINPATGPNATFTAKAKKPTPDEAGVELGAGVRVEEPGEGDASHPVEPPVEVAVLEPTYVIDEKVVPGPMGGGTPQAPQPGDVVEFHVRFDGVDKPKDFGDAGHFRWHLTQEGLLLDELAGLDLRGTDKPFEGREHRWDGDILVYSVYCHHAGSGKYRMDFDIPGTRRFTKEVALRSEANLDFFGQRCGIATGRHLSIVFAFEKYLKEGWKNYTDAYEGAKQSFKDHAEHKQLGDDIAWGILFAGLGGAVGGSVGGLVKFSATQKLFGGKVTKALGEAAMGALTDAPKDIAKYSVRLGKLATDGKGGGAPRADEATPEAKPSTGATEVPGSVDPTTWIATVEAATLNEAARMEALLAMWRTTALDARARGSTETIDFDPVNVITEITTLDGMTVDQIGKPPSAEEYEKSMWEAWIAKYAFEIGYWDGGGMLRRPPRVSVRASVVDLVTKESRAEMERVAAVLAKKGIKPEWLDEALTEARRAAEEEADSRPPMRGDNRVSFGP